MQSKAFIREIGWRRWFGLLCLFAVVIVSGVQAAHWDTQRAADCNSVIAQQNNDGLCPICFSVPVGHGAAPAAMVPFHMEGRLAVAPFVATSEGIQPDFHLHIRPPPAIA